MHTTILLIEDDADNVAACRIALRESGFELLHAPDGDSGIQLARERGPAFIVVDLTIPGRDGMSIVRQLQLDPATSSLPIVALTDGDEPAGRRRAREAGCHAFLPKDPEKMGITQSRREG